MTTQSPPRPAFRQLPFMGVIRVNEAAFKVGYSMGDPNWSNLGQGQPEVGDLSSYGAPPRIESMTIDINDHGYGHVEGLPELRDMVAAHYNRLYRQGKSSQYTKDNICLAAGGRLALSRIGSTLESMKLGYFTPDYTAYEDLMTTFHRLNPVHIELPAETGFRISPEELEARVDRDDLGALLISNPCNPTGVVIKGEELAAWVDMARRRNVTLLMDEFYSHYNYDGSNTPVSSAEFVEDVNEDPVVIIDGLTKCFRYPGWRIGWVVAPTHVITALTAAGSFLDGGPCRPMQRPAMEVLQPDRADQETNALRKAFMEKRDLVVERLTAMGVTFPCEPQGTFYAYGYVGDLPAPLNTGLGFMKEAFKHRVLTVPGEYFDVNPNREREGQSPLTPYIRFSYGPPIDNVRAGLDRLAEMVKAANG
ncbi:MAG: pyridoxal phosphate-dependent aminotransferase [Planctomycetota bacterium]|nr:pyridoxal phosphate-dependent aminotransferase [Planctomycetota bacterium]